MDTQRLILFFVFSFSLVMLWDAWQKDHHPPVQPSAQVQKQASAEASVPSPSVPTRTAPAAQQAGANAIPPATTAGARGKIVTVKTDDFIADIDLRGGNIVRLDLRKQRAAVNPDKNFVLFSPVHHYAAESGLLGVGLPTHKTLFSAESSHYALSPGKDKLQVRLYAPGPNGVKTVKILTFHRGSYIIDITHEIINDSTTPVAAHAYFQFLRDGLPPAGNPKMVRSYTGAAIYTEQTKYHKISFSDLEKNDASFPKTADNGWIAMLQHYFVAVWLPKQGSQREYYAKALADKLYSIGVIVPMAVVPPKSSGSVTVSLYAGPQEQDALKAIAPGLNLTVDYGWFTVVAAPLFSLLQFLHKLVGNWGVAIIVLTVLIKAAFFPLSAASYKSMAKMKLVTPRMTKLREQYGNDRARLNQAMMELYKAEKINPLGGCLPIVVQIPVFISLYYVLLYSVELRYAPFYLWIHDLSSPDPYYVLPVLMMVSMLVQTKLNPVPPDPIQAKVMLIMPLAFGVMFFFFPSGLVLYYLVNNILSIAQQWQISRMMGGNKNRARR